MLKIKIEDILKREAYLHVLFWLLFILFPLVKYSGDEYIIVQWKSSNSNIFLTIIFAYICYCYLFKLRNKNKFLLLILFTLIMTVLGTFFSEIILKMIVYQLNKYSFWRHSLGIFGEYFFIGILFFCFYSIKRNYHLDNQRKIAEVNSLKAQINPHFLLNTLNSIYAYSLEGSRKASELILKLSDNFKYILHEGQKSKVAITSDIEHIKDFIEINTLRWGNKIDFKFNEQIENYKLQITPLILITFVENAVKYTSKLKGDYHKIEIEYVIDANNILSFSCRNPFDINYKLSEEWEESGIGLANAKSRLELIYKDKYKLMISDKEAIFVVNLKIEL